MLTSDPINPKVAKPPVAKTVPKTTELHGDTLVDPYHWLQEKSNPEVIRYLEAENAYTEAVMRPTAGLQERLYTEMLSRIKEDDQSAPYPKNGYYYSSRTEKGKSYPIHLRRKGMRGEDQVILDVNALAEGKRFMAVGAFSVSDDTNLLAYSTDETGFRQYVLHVRDLRTGKDLPFRAERVVSVAWAADSRTLFYTVEDDAKRSYRVIRHPLDGSPEVVYEERDALYRVYVGKTLDGKYLVAHSESSETTEERVIPADKPQSEPRVLIPREDGHEYSVDHRGGEFFIRTNRNAKNFRLVRAPVRDPSERNWREVVPHDPKVRFEGLRVFQNHAVLAEREQGLPHLRVLDLSSGRGKRISVPEAIYTVALDTNAEFATDKLRFAYASPVTPASIYELDMKTGRRRLLKRQEVPGGHDPERYVTERIWATAEDGTKVPMSVVYLKGTKRDGSAPLLLYAYGSYGATVSFGFNASLKSLLDRGVVYVQAQIRGGGDLGEEWYDAGKMMKKRNTFTDFIACGDHLVHEGYTSRERMAIMGGSAGGLLIGAVVNMRPDLCRTAVLLVPFVDVINTMLDESLPLTVGEFLEWGNPKKEAEYRYIRTYSPYENIEPKEYPDMLVRTALDDSQVMYHEPAKYVARMRATKKGESLLLFKTNMAAGHGGASGRYDALRERAFDYAFLLAQFGIADKEPIK